MHIETLVLKNHSSGPGQMEVKMELSLELKKAAAWEWKCRRNFELEAMARFQRLALTLDELEGQIELAALARKAASDEKRHADQCAELVSHFGGQAVEKYEPHDRQVSPPGCSPEEALLYEMVAMSCITETLSCALLGALVERATDKQVKDTMHSILRDEIGHSRLGWAFLAGTDSRSSKRFVADRLPAMLAGTVTQEIFEDRPSHALEEPLSHLGALTRKERLHIFQESMHAVVFPGLERFDIDTRAGERWLSKQLLGEGLGKAECGEE
jgi:bacterioferritin (cytochrome b1)